MPEFIQTTLKDGVERHFSSRHYQPVSVITVDHLPHLPPSCDVRPDFLFYQGGSQL